MGVILSIHLYFLSEGKFAWSSCWTALSVAVNHLLICSQSPSDAQAASSCCTNCAKGSPSALHQRMHSTTSKRRSPRSHLLIKTCVSSKRSASCTCVICRSRRAAFRRRRNNAYCVEWMDLSIYRVLENP